MQNELDNKDDDPLNEDDSVEELLKGVIGDIEDDGVNEEDGIIVTGGVCVFIIWALCWLTWALIFVFPNEEDGNVTVLKFVIILLIEDSPFKIK